MVHKGYSEEEYFIPQEDLFEFAVIAAVRGIADRLLYLDNWSDAMVVNEPTFIHDINNSILFLDFPIKANDAVVGIVRTAASKIFGNPIISLIVGSSYFPLENYIKQLKKKLAQEYPSDFFNDPIPVCFSYPKIGLMVYKENIPKERLIFEIPSLQLVEKEWDQVKPHDGLFHWSLYKSMDEKERLQGIELFEIYNEDRMQISKKDLELAINAQLLSNIDPATIKPNNNVTKTKVIQFCLHCKGFHRLAHHCFLLHSQMESDYNAIATCQMILCFYRYYYSQQQIAPQLGYLPGGCPENHAAGYRSLTNQHLIARYTSTPTKEAAIRQIDENNPFKSGILGHARACAGYSVTTLTGLVDSTGLLIYDPCPADPRTGTGGSVYWEYWYSVEHTNCIYTQLDY